MAERTQSGHYTLGTVDSSRSREPEKTIGVIKGGVANDTHRGGFSRILGLSKSKWYVYEEKEHLRNYADRSGTGVLSVVSLEDEYGSKSTAVDAAERRYNL